MDVSNFKYKELTEQIIGAAMQVHSHLGNGFKEIIYQRALAIELNSLQIKYRQEFHVPIYYKDGGFSCLFPLHPQAGKYHR